MEIIKHAKEVLEIEAQGILSLVDKIDSNFVTLVDTIYESNGRVIISGIGKSGLVGRKIAATMSSTGTNSLFLHPVEAMHGDLGMVSPNDVFIALSNSGETSELNLLMPSVRKIGCKLVAMTGRTDSTLAKLSDMVIDVGVSKEACPMGLAPTASTTALLAMGDALAVALIHKRDFKPSDFKKFHPGGQLGQRLSSKVGNLMLKGDLVPIVRPGTDMKQALLEMDKYAIGAIIVCDDECNLAGIITDGDIRHNIVKNPNMGELKVDDIMTRSPRSLDEETPGYDALNMMEKYQITVLPITSGGNRVIGVLHLHDILGKGEFKFNAS
ncbi:KpsF/GutQ family sugar-phosphate isomerase [Desulforegula conservatrix]|uniref:KpsF/GutQ family sugar-phosphate isomerase n=1 Tax=Desulforegula conservatrix TaxID=153026 RepID=UPI000418143E|nr:KpsF/GutQ family sugar-phosphate isomerase [Desulforegula conservatrix]